MIRLGIVGLGYWGPIYCRILSHLPGVKLTAVHDLRPEPTQALAQEYQAFAAPTLQDLLPAVDAVVLATPASTHYVLAAELIAAGKHVLCEKPVTLELLQHIHLNGLATGKKVVLFPGLTYLFHPGVQALKRLYLDEQILGKPCYARSTRTNLGPVRSDVSALQDLAPHDIAILSYLFGKPALYYAQEHFSRPDRLGQPDAGSLTLAFENGIEGQVWVSWSEPGKRRNLRVVFENDNMVEFDDMQVQPLIEHKGTNSRIVPITREQEPLQTMVEAFIQSIHTGGVPSDLMQASAHVTDMLEQATRWRQLNRSIPKVA